MERVSLEMEFCHYGAAMDARVVELVVLHVVGGMFLQLQ